MTSMGYYPKISFLSANLVRFTFPHLRLKPASWDGAANSGFISYSIQQKPD